MALKVRRAWHRVCVGRHDVLHVDKFTLSDRLVSFKFHFVTSANVITRFQTTKAFALRRGRLVVEYRADLVFFEAGLIYGRLPFERKVAVVIPTSRCYSDFNVCDEILQCAWLFFLLNYRRSHVKIHQLCLGGDLVLGRHTEVANFLLLLLACCTLLLGEPRLRLETRRSLRLLGLLDALIFKLLTSRLRRNSFLAD